MKITPEVFHAFLKCPTKCFLLAKGETGTGNEYAEWFKKQNDAYQKEGVKRLMAGCQEGECVVGSGVQENIKEGKWRYAVAFLAGTQNLESTIHAIERIPSAGRGKAAQFIPIRFVFINKLTKEDRLTAAFDALVLQEVLGREVTQGKIIHGDDHATLKVKTATLLKGARKVIEKITTLRANSSSPDLILNRHCGECEFQAQCRQKAIEKDDLSLLAGMTEKERKKLHRKGIFTVTQLSYTFRPRRARKRPDSKKEKYHPALKALAFREQKIHIIGSPQFIIDGTPVYLDVESIPDRNFYYLIGTRFETPAGVEHHSFWADSIEDEKSIWEEFLCLLQKLRNPVLVHYGHFEVTFLKNMYARHGSSENLFSLQKLTEQSLNLLSILYSQIYFPTYSNRLKEIAAKVGANWQSPNASGLQSIIWRYNWERTSDDALKQTLISYNQDDCQAVHLLSSELHLICKKATLRSDVDFAYNPKRNATEKGAIVHDAFEKIITSAYSSYNRSHIHIRERHSNLSPNTPRRKRLSPIEARYLSIKQGHIVHVRRAIICPIHPPHKLQSVNDQQVEHRIIDLRFTRNGCRKVITTYIGNRAYCDICQASYLPPVIKAFHQQIFGPHLLAWIVYQRVVLRLPIGVISNAMYELFEEEISDATVSSLIYRVASDYENTERRLWQLLRRSQFIHIDETKVNIRGSIQYVWVFTDGKHVVFHLTVTREATFLHKLLADYEGVVVSDFYAGYDALQCRQQKCLVHLIRDLNEDLWKNPFNNEYETFVIAVRDLLMPIFKDIERYGVKAWHLRKHTEKVEKFYEKVVNDPSPKCEVTATYHKRFSRYKESLFRFLQEDGIPWHNNAAECAIRHLAVQRKISGFFYKKGMQKYLRLLGIAQTCRFQSKSFLRFLLSGDKYVNDYKERQRRLSPKFFDELKQDDAS